MPFSLQNVVENEAHFVLACPPWASDSKSLYHWLGTTLKSNISVCYHLEF